MKLTKTLFAAVASLAVLATFTACPGSGPVVPDDPRANGWIEADLECIGTDDWWKPEGSTCTFDTDTMTATISAGGGCASFNYNQKVTVGDKIIVNYTANKAFKFKPVAPAAESEVSEGENVDFEITFTEDAVFQQLGIIASSDDTEVVINSVKAELVNTNKILKKTITDAEAAKASETIGDGFGEIPQDAVDALEAAIIAAKEISDSPDADRADYEAADKALENAVAEFKESKSDVGDVANGGLISRIKVTSTYFAPGWQIITDGVSGTNDQTGKVTFVTPSGTAEIWQCQLHVNPFVNVENGKTYKLTFKAKPTVEEELESFKFSLKFCNGGDEVITKILGETDNRISVTPNEENTVVLTGTAPKDIENVNLDFDFFGNPGFSLELYDFNLVVVE